MYSKSRDFNKYLIINEHTNINTANINGTIIRKNWRNWNVGRITIYETHEFDGDSITQGVITEVHSDHAILTADGMHLWIDDDTQFMFR